MTKMEAVAAIVGVLMPFLVVVLNQAKFPKWANSLIAIAACAGGGILTAYAMNLWSWTTILVAMATVFTVAQAEYLAFWQNSKPEAVVNTATSVVK
jgi:4-amino-4-deoxy-L-arabinose transferase-like glycosyltransferase